MTTTSTSGCIRRRSRYRDPRRAANAARRAIARLSRPSGDFDASRYFRGAANLGFHNVGTDQLRALARSVYETRRNEWSLDDAMAFADELIVDRYLDVKTVGVEVVARYRKQFTPQLLPRWKRWLAGGHSANWATTDAICGVLIGPYEIASHLHGDDEDLIQKAVGWALREAGKTDARRLEKYLRANGPSIPRTTLRYAIERFSPAKRRELLRATKTEGSNVRAVKT